MTHDVATMVGAFIIIFAMMYLLMAFGTRITAEMLNSGPLLVEENLAGHLTIASMASGNASISFIPRARIDVNISLSLDDVFVEPLTGIYIPSGAETERGSVKFSTPGSMQYVKIRDIKVREGVDVFDKRYSNSIDVIKNEIDNEMKIVVS